MGYDKAWKDFLCTALLATVQTLVLHGGMLLEMYLVGDQFNKDTAISGTGAPPYPRCGVFLCQALRDDGRVIWKVWSWLLVLIVCLKAFIVFIAFSPRNKIRKRLMFHSRAPQSDLVPAQTWANGNPVSLEPGSL